MDPSQHNLNSNFQIDQIIGIIDSKDVGPITVGASTNVNATFPTGIGDSPLFEGYFRVDGIDQAAPFGGKIYTGSGTNPIDPGIVILAATTPNSITIRVSNTSSSTRVVHFKVALLAKTFQQTVNAPVLSDPTAFSSELNYLKIAKQDTVDITVPAGAGSTWGRLTSSFEHGLGYNPLHKVWFEYNESIQRAESTDTGLVPVLNIAVIPTVDAQNLNILFLNNSTDPARQIKLHYRVYYDY